MRQVVVEENVIDYFGSKVDAEVVDIGCIAGAGNEFAAGLDLYWVAYLKVGVNFCTHC